MLQFVEVDEVRPVGGGPCGICPFRSSAEVGVEEQSYGFEPITFYPDGSSDTAEVVFSARESRRAAGGGADHRDDRHGAKARD
jgi:hypothetical protein